MYENKGVRPMPVHLKIIGLLLIATQILTNLIYHDIIKILWFCNISTVLAGVALFFGMQQIALVGATFMIVGLTGWFVNVMINNNFGEPISYITNFCYATVAVYIFFLFPVKKNLWLWCFGWYILCQVLSRLFSSPVENINMAFSIWPGWDKVFSHFFYFWCFITFSCLFFLFVMNKILLRIQKAKCANA